jgi:NADH-quinone oxidoreductase subunit M
VKGIPVLTLLTLLPLAGGIVVAGLGEWPRVARRIALAGALATLGLALAVWRGFDATSGELQFVERHDWIPSLGVSYFVGVDGLGLLMVLLTGLLVPMAMGASWSATDAGAETAVPGAGRGALARPHLYFALMLFLEAGLLGTFTAQNFFHWFLFWELSLVPAFFLVRLWGGPQRAPAATQFFLYTLVGSVAMLLAFLGIFLATGRFDFPALAEMGRDGTLTSALAARLGWYALTTKELSLLVFGGVLLGLAVKVPLMPLHTWLPAAYAEAPTPVTMLLTGAMSKMGVYGFVRVLLPLFPQQINWLLWPLLGLAVFTIVCSACAAFAQRDLKRLLAYSSINHLGYCLLAVFAVARYSVPAALPEVERAAALNGVFLQMFNHGLTAATLFLCVGFLEQRSGGLRGLEDFGGLRRVAPVFCGLMGIALFASLGLPGLNGFVGEFLIFKGVFALAPWAAAAALPGLLVTAVFLLTLSQRVFHGPLNATWSKLPDLRPGEIALVSVPVALMFALGLWPRLVLDVVNATAVTMVEQLKF